MPWTTSSPGGLEYLDAGVESVESLLVSIGSPRLARLGLPVENPFPSAEHRLYELLSAGDSDRPTRGTTR